MKIFVGSTAYEFVPSNQICLMNGADILEGGSLESNGVEEDDTLEMRMAVNAGMRKKWRKKRSKYMVHAYDRPM
jgi:hypothetical protein